MPGLGKSGTSRINFFRCSQFTSDLADDAFAITTLLQFEMCSDPVPASRLILQRCPRGRPLAPVANASAAPTTDRPFRLLALQRFHQYCCGPTLKFPASLLPVPQTSGSQRPERVREL